MVFSVLRESEKGRCGSNEPEQLGAQHDGEREA